MKVQSKKAKFLNGFSKIKVGSICKEYKIDVSNLQKGISAKEKEDLVYNRIIKELLYLFANSIFDDELEVIEWRKK